MITDDVTDATDKSSKEKFGVVAYCSIEASPSFMFPPPPQGSTASTAIAVLTKVLSPQKSEHKADLYVQQMQVVPPGDVKDVVEMFQRMQQHKPSNETERGSNCRYATMGTKEMQENMQIPYIWRMKDDGTRNPPVLQSPGTRNRPCHRARIALLQSTHGAATEHCYRACSSSFCIATEWAPRV